MKILNKLLSIIYKDGSFETLKNKKEHTEMKHLNEAQKNKTHTQTQ